MLNKANLIKTPLKITGLYNLAQNFTIIKSFKKISNLLKSRRYSKSESTRKYYSVVWKLSIKSLISLVTMLLYSICDVQSALLSLMKTTFCRATSKFIANIILIKVLFFNKVHKNALIRQNMHCLAFSHLFLLAYTCTLLRFLFY